MTNKGFPATTAMDEEAITAIIDVVLPIVRAMRWHVTAIAASTERETALTHVECLEVLENALPPAFRPRDQLRDAIRMGRGDYAEIQAKCVEMGLV